jgi:hypothetical protein
VATDIPVVDERRPRRRRTLARLTGAKTVTNVALRWIPPFLPTLERAFGATTTQLTTVLGVGEAAGLSTVFVGRHLDRGRERAVMIGARPRGASAVLALAGTLTAFAISFFVLVLGVSNFTVAGQAWISHRVDYRWRARSIGLYETSWAIALLAGAPLVAVLINVFGWRGPFVAIADRLRPRSDPGGHDPAGAPAPCAARGRRRGRSAEATPPVPRRHRNHEPSRFGPGW